MTAEDTAGPLPYVRQTQTLILFAATLFVSAAAMFMAQPMIGKMLLPLVGGTPAGWIVAMAFFQIMLLAGYALAWALSRFSPRTHGIVYISVLLLGSLMLPVTLPQQVAGDAGPWLVLKLLASSIGIPFIALSATSSTVQRLFSATRHAEARDPYFLYAASNLGSLGGLLLYPGVVETFLTLQQQSQLLLGAYAFLIVLAGGCLLVPGHAEPSAARQNTAPVPWKRRLHWIALAFFPSSLLLGVTMHITTDIISAPLVWVLPLAIYLLTFIVAFSRRPVVSLALAQKIQPTAVALSVALILIVNGFMPISFLAMAVHLCTFTVVALVCHMRLAELRPLDDERHLPDYYLMIALGGALGGMLNAFAAPMLFDNMAEYPLVLLGSCAMNPLIRSPFSFRYGILFLIGGTIMMILAVFSGKGVDIDSLRNALLVIVFALVTFHPRATIVAGAAIYLIAQFQLSDAGMRLMTRNFYGVIRVYDREAPTIDRTYHHRLFRHGTTTHGTQLLDAGLETIPTTYFSMLGPLGDVFRTFKPAKVAVMGLGAGTLACYSTPYTEFTFFEIDPAIGDMARSEFSFLDRCKGAQPHRVIIGDGRLKLAELKDEKFDLIILDAFSSDMVPVHLISQEAIQLYLQHLAEGGAIVFNLSSRYIRLESTLAAGAAAAGLDHRYWIDQRASVPFLLPSAWLVMGRPAAGLSRLEDANWHQAEFSSTLRPWTDSYSSVASVVRF